MESQLFEVPNLDCLTIDPIELRRAGDVFSLLACYAEHTARAMELRLEGDTDGARSFERAAQTVYDRLPDWAKW
jgi:hypothetical protein